jgi:hypothetical protein
MQMFGDDCWRCRDPEQIAASTRSKLDLELRARTPVLPGIDVTLIRDHDGIVGQRVLRLDEAARLRCVPGRPSWAPGARSRFPRLELPLSMARQGTARCGQHRQAAEAAAAADALTCEPAEPAVKREAEEDWGRR